MSAQSVRAVMYQPFEVGKRGERAEKQQPASSLSGYKADVSGKLNTLYATTRNSLFFLQVKLAKNDDIDLAEIRRGQTSIAEQLDVIQQELLAKIDKCTSKRFGLFSATNRGSNIKKRTFSRVHDRVKSQVRVYGNGPT